jgi:hypothetical protein
MGIVVLDILSAEKELWRREESVKEKKKSHVFIREMQRLLL